MTQTAGSGRFGAALWVFPLAFLLVVLTGLAAWTGIRDLRYNGDTSAILKPDSEAYQAYLRFYDRFQQLGDSTVIAIFAPDLADQLGDVSDLAVDLLFADGVETIVSLFSVPAENTAEPFLDRPEISALAPAEQLDQLWQQSTFARQILAEDRSLTIMTVIWRKGATPATRRTSLGSIMDAAPDNLDVLQLGPANINAEISEALKRDQLWLAITCTLLCTVAAAVLLRSLTAALIVTLPPLTGLVWCMGVMALTGVAMNPLLAVVPTLLLVLGAADGLHLYHAILRARRRNGLDRAIFIGVRETLPAAALTSATTAIAFLAMWLVSQETLRELAMLGGLGLAVQLTAVMLGVALFSRLFGVDPRRERGWDGVIGSARAALRYRKGVALLAIAGLGVLAILQTRVEHAHDPLEHLPRGAPVAGSLDRIEARIPGTDRAFLIVDAADPAPGLQQADAARLKAVLQVAYPAGEFDQLIPHSDTPGLSAFEAKGHDGFAIPIPIRYGTTSGIINAEVAGLRSRLDANGLADVAQITGVALIAAEQMPLLIAEIGVSFKVALAIIAAFALVATRSLALSFMVIVPNVIPVFALSAGLALLDRPLSLTGSIALTIAFGITVDDTIHFMNRLRLARRYNPPEAAIQSALRDAGPPVIATTVLVALGFITMLSSDMPSIRMFGMLVASAVLLAMVLDLYVLPSLVALAGRREKPGKETP